MKGIEDCVFAFDLVCGGGDELTGWFLAEDVSLRAMKVYMRNCMSVMYKMGGCDIPGICEEVRWVRL